jgi:hypothetical protein
MVGYQSLSEPRPALANKTTAQPHRIDSIQPSEPDEDRTCALEAMLCTIELPLYRQTHHFRLPLCTTGKPSTREAGECPQVFKDVAV